MTGKLGRVSLKRGANRINRQRAIPSEARSPVRSVGTLRTPGGEAKAMWALTPPSPLTHRSPKARGHTMRFGLKPEECTPADVKTLSR